ncbi:MAG: hypothetical protein ABII74_03295 [Elusimicrobiota bacterium]
MHLYFWTVIIIFWIPSAFLYLFLRKKLDSLTKKAFWITVLILMPVTFAAEYIYLWADIWNFSENYDPLIGISIWGAPIEEFIFWFGAPIFFTLVYLFFDYLDRRYLRKEPNA